MVAARGWAGTAALSETLEVGTGFPSNLRSFSASALALMACIKLRSLRAESEARRCLAALSVLRPLCISASSLALLFATLERSAFSFALSLVLGLGSYRK